MLLPAICSKCDELIICDKRDAFSQCPLCEKTISAHESIQSLRDYCAIPANTNDVIERCLRIEQVYGPELPLSILSILAESFPFNEHVAFLIVRMTNYDQQIVKNYLTRFKNHKKKAPFAEEFLEKAMVVRNMEFANLFEEYIERLPSYKQDRYVKLMRELYQSYIKVATSSPALSFLYGFYVIGGLLNFGMMLWFILDNMPLWMHAIIAAGVLGLQICFLFVHNRRFGNRVKISDRERLIMVIYMSSIVIAIGGVFLGTFINF